MPNKNAIALSVFLAGLWAHSSYSEPYSYGQTGNAAGDGLTWGMGAVLPPETGLTVNGIIYQYTTNKVTEDPLKVHVQNENALGSGYIFRETDDWSGLPSNTINKMVPVDNIGIQFWGDGSIETEGVGTVTDPTVIYTYRVDQCFDPQSSPICDGYAPPLDAIPTPATYEPYDALNDDAVRAATQATDSDVYDDEEEEKKDDGTEDAEEDRTERALAAADNALGLANAVSQEAILQAMNPVNYLTSYEQATIPGGVYKDAVELADAKIPDNKRGLRNGLAQQILHNQMVEMQYKRR